MPLVRVNFGMLVRKVATLIPFTLAISLFLKILTTFRARDDFVPMAVHYADRVSL